MSSTMGNGPNRALREKRQRERAKRAQQALVKAIARRLGRKVRGPEALDIVQILKRCVASASTSRGRKLRKLAAMSITIDLASSKLTSTRAKKILIRAFSPKLPGEAAAAAREAAAAPPTTKPPSP